jgi:site-specific recombinase XerD
MIESVSAAPISPLRQRLIEDMELRHFSIETKRNYIRDVARFATWLGRPPDKATAEDLRRFQVEQREGGMPSPTMNSVVAALRFFFTHTLDRPDLSWRLYREKHVRNLPVVLSREEVARLLQATTCLKHHAALAVRASETFVRLPAPETLHVSDLAAMSQTRLQSECPLPGAANSLPNGLDGRVAAKVPAILEQLLYSIVTKR